MHLHTIPLCFWICIKYFSQKMHFFYMMKLKIWYKFDRRFKRNILIKCVVWKSYSWYIVKMFHPFQTIWAIYLRITQKYLSDWRLSFQQHSDWEWTDMCKEKFNVQYSCWVSSWNLLLNKIFEKIIFYIWFWIVYFHKSMHPNFNRFLSFKK